MEKVGVVYVAFGAPYLAMALTSILSLRVFNPTSPVCVVTNVCRTPPNTTWWNNVQESHWLFVDKGTSSNRDIKTHIYKYSPFKKSLYLDCDTLVLADISALSFFLDHFDIVLRHAEPGTDAKRRLFDGAIRFGEIGHFQGGLIGFRKSAAVEQFFDCWRDRYKALGFRRDQPSLVEALYYSDVRLLPLTARWNRGDKWYSKARNSVMVWHYKVRMDKYIEECLLMAVKWFSDDRKDLDEVKAFIKNRRKSRGYGRSPAWLLRAVVSAVRGPLSKIPERHVGRKNWKKLLVTFGSTDHEL